MKQQLTEYELIPEEWGGSTICVPVSAKTGEGIDTLLEMVLLVADMEEIRPIRIDLRQGMSSRRSWIRAAALWLQRWCRTARLESETRL